MESSIRHNILKFGPYVAILVAGVILGGFWFNPQLKDAGATSPEHPRDDQRIWTCAMHPQIQEHKPGTCPLCGMELTIAAAWGGMLSDNEFSMSEESVALANISTVVVSKDSGEPVTIRLSGQIRSNPKTNSIQTTLFDGRLERLDVNYVGEYVREGQQIGLIYSPELYSAQDQLITSASYKNTHERLYNAARNNLGLWKLTDEQIDTILKTSKPIFNFPLFADVSGTVTEILANEGNYYRQGAPLYKLSNLGTVWAVFDVYEDQLPFLKTGLPLVVSTKAIKTNKWEGKVELIEPILDPAKRTVALRTTLANSDGMLKPGMFAEAEITTNKEGGHIAIPRSAVLWTGRRSLVYVKTHPEQPIFEMREVELGSAFDEGYEILDGLLPGEEVVVNGAFTLDAAAQLQRKHSMMLSNPRQGGIPAKAIEVPTKGHLQADLQYIIGNYLRLKDALVASDSHKAAAAAEKVVSGLSEEQLLSGMPDNSNGLVEEIRNYALAISKSTSLAQQRKEFKPFSEAMIRLVSEHSPGFKPLYVQFCPMADGNKGANWLSLETEILNPYFGTAMLHCGRIDATLR